MTMLRAFGMGLGVALAIGASVLTPAEAQTVAPAASPPAQSALKLVVIEKLSGVWVEGPGYEITYGAAYDVCAQRCLNTPKCVMLEYYRPEKKCNHYDTVRPRKTGGSSDVGIKR